MDAGGELTAVDAAFPPAEAIAAVHDSHAPSPTTEDDCDDLYGDVDLGFLPLSPPSHYPTSPPKTPSPGHSALSPSPPPPPPPPPRRGPLPDPTAKAEPEPPKPTPQQQPQPLLPAAKPAPPRASPPTTAVFIGELPYWTTDAEVEGALAPHGALQGLHFFTDKLTGKSRGFCRAGLPQPRRGRVGRPPRSTGAPSTGATASPRSPARPRCSPSAAAAAAMTPTSTPRAPRAAEAEAEAAATGATRRQLGAMWGLLLVIRRLWLHLHGLSFHSVVGCWEAAAALATAAFLAASGMAMGGTGMWYDQRMTGMWVGQQPWNFGGYGMPRHQQKPPMQQPNRNGDYGTVRGTARRGRPAGGRNEGDTGNANGNERGYPDRRQCGRGRDGFDLSRKHGHEERGRYRPRVLEEEREHERNWDESDRYGGDRRRYQEYPERDFERRGRVRSRSSSRDGDDDDHPGRHC
ncbi:hypothetical protein OsJ_15113 [Oryza sativa Japonica Group]|uniref:RRM domain-containing protein n=1 Tax=Oryza sativa subsp. japonica TaxID=39947 RepID=B9FFL8_ORYSJ|nr:hypothetical protein OsJ_15113 [Oryza sativa Japonica Group]